ncbi:hypothetical protein [Rummeliibacillus suwonensis]|uniref:hypothetical protein n=1 Tax=Rummeliibacillus suwonensis TaxID=1306154 RepID=UPI001AB00108|nr:hypothetical protein [Rummeliibacillus suwonensis]MBO2536300.1 hypothetical protein [Rummeliibacillus suwonensis]
MYRLKDGVTSVKTMNIWDVDRVHAVVKEHLPNWTIMGIPKKITGNAKVKLVCPRGHENEKQLHKIDDDNGLGCKECNRIKAREDCYEKFVNLCHQEGYKMVSTVDDLIKSDKSPAQTKLKLTCPNGEPYNVAYTHFSSRGNRCSCKKCKPHGATKGKKYTRWTQEKVERVYLETGLIFHGEFKTVREKYKTECTKCGHVWKPYAYAILNNGQGCPVCSGSRGTLGTITKWVQENRPEFEVLQGQEYKNTMTHIKIKCKKHNEVFSITPNNFKSGYNGCTQCNSEKQSKVTKKMVEQYDLSGSNSPCWNGLTPLKTYLRSQLNEWKQHSMQHYNYTCQITGKSFDVIHHTTAFSYIVQKTMSLLGYPIYEEVGMYTGEQLDNITNVCLWLHDWYGYGIPLTNEEHDLYHSSEYAGMTNINIDSFMDFMDDRGVHISELYQQKLKNNRLELNYQ